MTQKQKRAERSLERDPIAYWNWQLDCAYRHQRKDLELIGDTCPNVAAEEYERQARRIRTIRQEIQRLEREAHTP